MKITENLSSRERSTGSKYWINRVDIV